MVAITGIQQWQPWSDGVRCGLMNQYLAFPLAGWNLLRSDEDPSWESACVPRTIPPRPGQRVADEDRDENPPEYRACQLAPGRAGSWDIDKVPLEEVEATTMPIG